MQFLTAPYSLGVHEPAALRAVLAAADAYIEAHTPYKGAYWVTGDVGLPAPVDFSYVRDAGFAAVSPYYVLPFLWPDGGWPVFPLPNPDPGGNAAWPIGRPYAEVVQTSIGRHAQGFAQSVQTGVKFITAVAPDVDSRMIYWAPQHLYFSGQNHVDYWTMLADVRGMADATPSAWAISSNTGKPLVGLGPWNEQGESSTVEPGYSTFQRPGGGNGDPFFMASAAAKVFGGPEQYDSYLPGDHGRGFPAKSDWTFSYATGAGLDEWANMATCGLSLNANDELVLTGVNGAVINTPTFVPTAAFARVKVLVRVDEGAERLQFLDLHTKASDYSPTAHEFGAPEEPGRQFFGPLYRIGAAQWTPFRGYRLYTFEVAQAPQLWQGTLKFLEVRFVTFAGSAGPTRFAVKRIRLE